MQDVSCHNDSCQNCQKKGNVTLMLNLEICDKYLVVVLINYWFWNVQNIIL